MNAVINRMAERIAPSLRTSGANRGLVHAVTAAMPAHCNESVSVTRTTAALVWRFKMHVQEARISFGTNCYRTLSGQSAVRQTQTVSSSKGGSVYSSQRLIHDFNGDVDAARISAVSPLVERLMRLIEGSQLCASQKP